MIGAFDHPLAIVYATPSAQAIAELVAASYALPAPITSVFLKRGFNDLFEVTAADGQRFVLRLSGRRARGEADVATETAFVDFLDRQSVPVAAPISANHGGLFVHASMPEGPRPAVLFRFLEGRAPRANMQDARAQGVTLASIHTAAETFVAPAPGRYRLDLNHLLHRPLASILRLESLNEETRNGLSLLAKRLAQTVSAMRDLTRTRCHGDCHGSNARMAATGDQPERAAFFDFDDGGPGFLAYDLSVFLWARTSFQRREHAAWHAFVEGYRSVRAISAADFDAEHVFVPILNIWIMGEYASRLREWGREVLPPDWIAAQLAFLHAWESEKLAQGLLRSSLQEI